MFDCGKKAGRPKALASKQLYHDEDGRTYLIERLNHQFFQSAKYPVVWDYSTESGTLSSDTTWYASNTYYVSDNLSTGNYELRIEPGTFVKFYSGKGISVSGTGKIIARGKPYLPIVFTSRNDDNNGEVIAGSSNLFRGAYDGLEVGDGSQIEFCSFYYADRAIDVNGELGLAIQHNYFYMIREGIHLADDALASGESLTIFNNLMVVDPVEPENDPCVTPTGINIGLITTYATANVYIRSNTIHCADVGLLLNDPCLPYVTVENNIFSACLTGILGEGIYDFDCLTNNYNGYYDPDDYTEVSVTGKSIGGASPVITSSPFYAGYLSDFYLNDTSGAGEDFLDVGNGTPTAAGYTDPQAWSIHSIAMDYSSDNVFDSAETIENDETWAPEYGTCDNTGDVDLGYHHPRVDYIIHEGTVTVDDEGITLTVDPGTVVVQKVNSSTGAGQLVIDGTDGDKLVCAGDPSGDGYVTWVDFYRARHDAYNGVPFSIGYDFIEFEDGSEYDVRFTKFYGMGDALAPSGTAEGTIQDCVFLLNRRGVNYIGCSVAYKVQNCLFMGSIHGVRDYGGDGGEVKNCTFDHNLYGVVLDGTGGGTLTVKDCLFHTNITEASDGQGISYRDDTATLTRSYNIYYGNDHNVWDYGEEEEMGYGTGSDVAGSDPYDSAWIDFDDRFRLDQGGDCVDAGDPASSVGSFYSTALARFADDGITDIGYHYPRIVRVVKWDATGNDDGTSWDDAYLYLQDALDEAALGGIDAVCTTIRHLLVFYARFSCCNFCKSFYINT